MTGSPELECPNGSDQNVKQERRRSNDRRCEPEQCHYCDITRRAGMTDRRVKKCDHANGKKKKNEVCCIHVLSRRADSRHIDVTTHGYNTPRSSFSCRWRD